jgi:hypothetical protein
MKFRNLFKDEESYFEYKELFKFYDRIKKIAPNLYSYWNELPDFNWVPMPTFFRGKIT